jgi:hypothetical protein
LAVRPSVVRVRTTSGFTVSTVTLRRWSRFPCPVIHAVDPASMRLDGVVLTSSITGHRGDNHEKSPGAIPERLGRGGQSHRCSGETDVYRIVCLFDIEQCPGLVGKSPMAHNDSVDRPVLQRRGVAEQPRPAFTSVGSSASVATAPHPQTVGDTASRAITSSRSRRTRRSRAGCHRDPRHSQISSHDLPTGNLSLNPSISVANRLFSRPQ